MFSASGIWNEIERRGRRRGRRHFIRSSRAFQWRHAPLAALLGLVLAGCALDPGSQDKPPAEEKLPAEQTEKKALEGEPQLAQGAESEAPRARTPAAPAAPAAPRPGRSPASALSERDAAAAAQAFKPAAFAELPGWWQDDHAAALAAFLLSCQALGARDAWRGVCTAAQAVPPSQSAAARRFFETHFRPYRALAADGAEEGLITGYYEPLLQGSRKPSARYRFPLYAVPEDLLVIDLSEVHPELKGRRVRGRLEGRRVVPYYSRAQIESKEPPFAAKPLFWVDDPIDLFFLQVQGSGQIRLESGERVRVGYADQNGHPYRSIGRFLIERGELTLERASMQSIKDWARQNPEKLAEVLQHNGSYVFFRELPGNLSGPLGALGVPVSAGRSLAVDPAYVPLGAPVYLATAWPNTTRPLRRLVMAQDTGSAIRGPLRGDFFWGYGEQAGVQAGRMRQSGRMWILVPLGIAPERMFVR